jgi:hypothetical protein
MRKMRSRGIFQKLKDVYYGLPEISRRFISIFMFWFIVWTGGRLTFLDEEVSIWKNVFAATFMAIFYIIPLAYSLLKKRWQDHKRDHHNDKQVHQ